MNTYRHLKAIVDKILYHFNAWQSQVLSYVGRVCLINLVITSSFVQSFMIYKWPMEWLSFMQKSFRNFLLSGLINNSSGVHVAWTQCCKLIKSGKLGVKNLKF